MVRDSKVFLMDEPLSNLDAKLRNQMRAEIILLRQKLDTTFIYVTHDQTEAMTLGDRIVIMKDGYIMQVGTPTEVFERPANLFVAEFIGAPKMNIIQTELEAAGGKYYVKPFGARIEVDGEKGELLKAGRVPSREILLGVRPEHIVLAKSAEGAIPVTLEVNEMMGSELHLHVYTDDGTRLIVRVPTIDLTAAERENLATPWTAAYQASLSMGFSRQEHWSGLPCLPPGDIPNPGIEPMSLISPALAGRFFTTSTTWLLTKH